MLIHPYSANQSFSAGTLSAIGLGRLETVYWMSDVKTPLSNTVAQNEKLRRENFDGYPDENTLLVSRRWSTFMHKMVHFPGMKLGPVGTCKELPFMLYHTMFISLYLAYLEFFVEVAHTDTNCASIVDHVVEVCNELFADWNIQN